MALSSNSNAGSTETKVGAGALSNFTENKSNGNFSGGDINFDTSKLSINNPFDTKESQQPTFNTDDVFKPTLSGNLDIDLPKTNNNNSSSNNTTYSNNSNEPTMTVDEVYGKSNNQPVVEKQGDYSASSNEKSNVETSTFGKQDEVSVTPTSVTKNKGMVDNAAIQSVEGLDFQQKDKASVDVLDSKKKRDEVEAEDRADSMRNKLKANVNNAKQEEGGEDFRIGTSEAEKAFNEENARRQADLEKKKKAAEKAKNNASNIMQETEDEYNLLNNKLEKLDKDIPQLESKLEEAQKKADDIEPTLADLEAQAKNLENMSFTEQALNDFTMKSYKLEKKLVKMAKEYGIDIDAIDNDKSWFTPNGPSYIKKINKVVSVVREQNEINIEKAKKDLEYANVEKEQTNESLNKIKTKREEANGNQLRLEKEAENAQKEYNTWKTEAWANVQAGNTPESESTPQSGAETSHNDAMNAIKNSKDATPEQQARAEEALTNLENSRQKLEEAAAKARSGNPADMVAYQEALEKFSKNLKKAQEIGNRFTQTDFNKDYTRAVANANDFEVTLSDGTKMEYSDFAIEEVTKSPQYAKAMYEKKAQDYETNGHPILAKIERWKAKMSQTWLGSKLTFADNKVRNQFNQMAETNMRATYAANNNILNDETGKYSDEDKAEASKSINQAKALMTASVALQASTGFLSGIGDSMDDGVYGVTNPETRNAWQKTLNTVDNIIRITLGLGISPAANKAYQNMYYMAGDKVNNSFLFNKDFDSDGFALCEEYGYNAATGLIAGSCELMVGVAMVFNPATAAYGINLIIDAISTAHNGLYGVRDNVEKSQKYTQEVLEYFKDAENIAESSGNEEAIQEITNAITQIENFELKADEVGNLDNWLEGSGSNTASNEKFNQSLTYDEWLKLIEADPTMREYAKSIAKKKDKNAQKNNADAGVNS